MKSRNLQRDTVPTAVTSDEEIRSKKGFVPRPDKNKILSKDQLQAVSTGGESGRTELRRKIIAQQVKRGVPVNSKLKRDTPKL